MLNRTKLKYFSALVKWFFGVLLECWFRPTSLKGCFLKDLPSRLGHERMDLKIFYKLSLNF
jgi:hypothetical protein